MTYMYIAGPMTGISQFNYPAFDKAAIQLAEAGHEVVSPSELSSPESRTEALASLDGASGSAMVWNGTWGDVLARDIKILVDSGIEEIRVLDGWSRSRGARLETFVGRALCDIPVFTLSGRPVRLWRLVIAWVFSR